MVYAIASRSELPAKIVCAALRFCDYASGNKLWKRTEVRKI
jgi:hypothetical protein